MLSQLRERGREIDSLGADILAVGTGSEDQARRLVREGLGFPALLDPDKNLYRALGIGALDWRQTFRLGTWRRYLGSFRHARQGKLTGDILQAPGMVIVDADLTLRYLHRGVTLGDYPPVAEVLSALARITGGRC